MEELLPYFKLPNDDEVDSAVAAVFFFFAASAASFDGLEAPPKRRPFGYRGTEVMTPSRCSGTLSQGVSLKNSFADIGGIVGIGKGKVTSCGS